MPLRTVFFVGSLFAVRGGAFGEFFDICISQRIAFFENCVSPCITCYSGRIWIFPNFHIELIGPSLTVGNEQHDDCVVLRSCCASDLWLAVVSKTGA